MKRCVFVREVRGRGLEEGYLYQLISPSCFLQLLFFILVYHYISFSSSWVRNLSPGIRFFELYLWPLNSTIQCPHNGYHPLSHTSLPDPYSTY